MPVQPGRYGPGVPGAAWQTYYSGLTEHYASPATVTLSEVVSQPAEEAASPEEHSGAASLEQSSTVAGTGAKDGQGAAALSQSSTFAVTGRKATSGSGTASQSSTLTATGVHTGGTPGVLNQASTVSASGTKAATGSGAASQTSTLTASGIKALPIATLSDNFDNGTIDTAKWEIQVGTVQEAGGRVRLRHDFDYPSLGSVGIYDLTGGSVTVEAFPATDLAEDESGLVLQVAGVAVASLMVYEGNIRGRINHVSGTAVTYNATSHRWWRIREASGIIYTETSPDRSTWTALYSAAATATASKVILYAGNNDVPPATNPDRWTEFDNLNFQVASGTGSVSQSSTVTGSGVRSASGVGATSQSTTATGSGTKVAFGSASASQSSTTTASGSASQGGAATGSGSIDQASTLAATGTTARSGSASLEVSTQTAASGTGPTPTPPPPSDGGGGPRWHPTRTARPPRVRGRGHLVVPSVTSAAGMCSRIGRGALTTTARTYAHGRRNVESDRQRLEDELLLLGAL